MSILKRVFCTHKYKPHHYMDIPLGDGRYKREHVWKCVKCGKILR